MKKNTDIDRLVSSISGLRERIESARPEALRGQSSFFKRTVNHLCQEFVLPGILFCGLYGLLSLFQKPEEAAMSRKQQTIMAIEKAQRDFSSAFFDTLAQREAVRNQLAFYRAIAEGERSNVIVNQYVTIALFYVLCLAGAAYLAFATYNAVNAIKEAVTKNHNFYRNDEIIDALEAMGCLVKFEPSFICPISLSVISNPVCFERLNSATNKWERLSGIFEKQYAIQWFNTSKGSGVVYTPSKDGWRCPAAVLRISQTLQTELSSINALMKALLTQASEGKKELVALLEQAHPGSQRCAYYLH